MIFGIGKSPRHEESWKSYFTTVEEHHASIFFDMGLVQVAPMKKFPNLLAVNVQYPDFDENGLPTVEQAEVLFAIEDALSEGLKSEIGAIYSGRMTYHMQREFYFYLSNRKDVKRKGRVLVEAIFDRFSDYPFTTDCGEDVSWEHYRERLYPSEEERQVMNNMSLLTVLVERGDALDVKHVVQHLCVFREEKLRDLFRNDVEGMGFAVVTERFYEDGSELPYAITIEREDLIGFGEINSLTLPLYALAKKHNGYYDGWKAPILNQGKS